MELQIPYEDNDMLAIEKPAGVVVFNEAAAPAGAAAKTVIDMLLEARPNLKNVGEAPRYGVVHRLDKDTSGILLVAKTADALIFLQKQFKNREVEKKYTALVEGIIKEPWGTIHTLMGRAKGDPRKQKAYALELPISNTQFPKNVAGKREAITDYNVLKKFTGYALLEVKIKTGRKHQIRCHLAYIHHPVAGDTLYGFKDSPVPKGLARQFLHASYLKITLPSGETKEFKSELPEELQTIIKNMESGIL
ncbi:MAG: hypothetical protein A3D44_03580 [Candidatus Staskawiczbacteria bacterium RIFCSPHIGHO2_02_FULL_42_22]|uniref:Pseudouridine synthase RsuA/RluA-like domain-containing protein n=1 Tax=Candidatus Staskawiczbacteria bacterium RIFCSPHIGHO2_02_FULL_42_22 TaxID=1802207 RepID=A0A1G2I3V1_9BACT|nr:MAG: hypothetical protein A3D44_03580 [Candidatus Staskawiczbacteria bacterium RIFCSPHIGHO2_02_FULL_42_22]